MAIVTAVDTVLIVTSTMELVDTIIVPYGRPVAMMVVDNENVLECLVPVSQNVLDEWRWNFSSHLWTKGRRFPSLFHYYSYKAKLRQSQTPFVPAIVRKLSAHFGVRRKDAENTLMFANEHIAVWRYVENHVPFLYYFADSSSTVLDTVVTNSSINGNIQLSDLKVLQPLACYYFSENPRWHYSRKQLFAVSISEDGKTGYLAQVWFSGFYLYKIDVDRLRTLSKNCLQ